MIIKFDKYSNDLIIIKERINRVQKKSEKDIISYTLLNTMTKKKFKRPW